MGINVFDNASFRIDDYVNEIIEMQRRLTATQAIGPENGGKGEYEKAEYIKERLEVLNPDELIEINAPDERVQNGYRPNIAVLFNGRISYSTLWIITHLDVVPPGNLKLWESDPFKIEIKDKKIYGRGVEDNQQGLVASYMAVKALKDEDAIPYRRIGLLMVSDEETGSEKGLKYVLSQRKDLFGDKDLIIVPDFGSSEGTMVEVAEKSLLWLKFQVLGKQGHSSRPDLAINSFKVEAYLVSKLDRLYETYNQEDPMYTFPKSSFESTKKEANVPNINTIPGEDIFYMDCRILPKIKVDDVISSVNAISRGIGYKFKVKVNVSMVQRADAAPSTDANAPVVKALIRAIKSIKGEIAKPMGIGGGTVAAFLRREGIPVAVWATIDERAHQPNEYCTLDNIINDAKVFLHVTLQES